MKRMYAYCIVILFIFSCTNQHIQHDNKAGNKELQKETQSLKALHDSFNRTGDYNYMTKYILKIDELIKKYPNQKGFKQTKKMMIEMFGDSLHLEPENLKKQE